MRNATLAVVLALFVLGCPPKRDPASPQPIPVPDSDLCGQMCDHIGPAGLKCEEGEPLYNSDLPGEPGKPNQSCKDWCEQQQGLGVYINPRCVMQVKSCGEIEAARKKTCQ